MMKRILIVLGCLLILCGCVAPKPEETPVTQPTESEPTITESEKIETPSPEPTKVSSDSETIIDIDMQKGEDNMSVVISVLPNNLAEFEALAEGKLNDPEYTCALFLCAINLYAQDPEVGKDALNIVKGPQPLNNYEISWYKDRLRDKKYLPLVYFKGATPENDYQPAEPYTLSFDPDPRPGDLEEGYMKLYISAPAYDSPRYFLLRQKGENWYIWEIYSIMQGVRTPASQDPWS